SRTWCGAPTRSDAATCTPSASAAEATLIPLPSARRGGGHPPRLQIAVSPLGGYHPPPPPSLGERSPLPGRTADGDRSGAGEPRGDALVVVHDAKTSRYRTDGLWTQGHRLLPPHTSRGVDYVYRPPATAPGSRFGQQLPSGRRPAAAPASPAD